VLTADGRLAIPVVQQSASQDSGIEFEVFATTVMTSHMPRYLRNASLAVRLRTLAFDFFTRRHQDLMLDRA
jgi:hypothetical protein